MNTRDELLQKLRATLERSDLRFPPRRVEPLTAATRMTVTQASGSPVELAERFGAELQKLYGTFEVLETPTEARLALINRLLGWMQEEEQTRKGAIVGTEQARQILTWDAGALPIPGLETALADLELEPVAPPDLRDPAVRDRVRHIRYGLTGVVAAFAATGSMLVTSGVGTSRAASLLPIRHIGLVPFSRLYPTAEDWLRERRQAGELEHFFRNRANVSMISGPSKSADIEMNLTLGVHGPKYVHVILFDDEVRRPD
ncbi:MAG: lactate utilization protein [Litorilinea sp.]